MNLLIFFIFIVSFGLNGFTVLIDPGHGGVHAGTINVANKAQEKDIVLSVSLKLAQALKNTNLIVLLTRDSDREFDVDKKKDIRVRTEYAQSKKPDLFISLHCDFLPKKEIQGFCIYVPKKFSLKSYTFASYIHKELISNLSFGQNKTHYQDRGIRSANFHMINQLACPAVLIELDCLSNEQGTHRLMQSSYQQKLAYSLAQAIISYAR